MESKSWSDAVFDAVRRHVQNSGSAIFSRQELIDNELDAIVADTGTAGITPHQTLSRELQHLRDTGAIEFVAPGKYRWLEDVAVWGSSTPSKGVFVVGSHSIYKDEPERFYRFPKRWMQNALKVVNNWIIYQEPKRAGQRGYYGLQKFVQL